MLIFNPNITKSSSDFFRSTSFFPTDFSFLRRIFPFPKRHLGYRLSRFFQQKILRFGIFVAFLSDFARTQLTYHATYWKNSTCALQRKVPNYKSDMFWWRQSAPLIELIFAKCQKTRQKALFWGLRLRWNFFCGFFSVFSTSATVFGKKRFQPFKSYEQFKF